VNAVSDEHTDSALEQVTRHQVEMPVTIHVDEDDLTGSRTDGTCAPSNSAPCE
jgi:hypothetical protein